MQNKAAPKRLLDYVIVIGGLFVVILGICIGTLVMVLLLKDANKPGLATLEHAQGDIIVIAETRADLEQAIQAAEKWGDSFIRAVLAGETSDRLEGYPELEAAIASGRIHVITGPVKCIVLTSDRSACQVRIADGYYSDVVGWVPKACVRPSTPQSR